MGTNRKQEWVPMCVTACLFLAAGGFLAWRYMTNESLPMPSGDQTGTGVTQAVQTKLTDYWDDYFLPTSPEAWHTVGETVDWNGILSVCAEEYTVGKTLPEGFHRENITYYVPGPIAEQGGESLIAEETDENGTLTSPHVYVEVTASFACIGMPKSIDGLPASDKLSFAAANQMLSCYSREAGKIFSTVELDNKNLLSTEPKLDEHASVNLNIGDTIRLRLLYILPESIWQESDTEILFTPQSCTYNTATLTRMEYKQPHIWLLKT